MKGSVEVFPEVKQLYTFAASHDVHDDFTWQPRTHAWLQYADELSRIPDSSEMFLRRNQFVLVCKLRYKGRLWGWPTLDVFAGAVKGQHQVGRFYTLHYAPGCLAVNAMHQHWSYDAQVGNAPSLVWLFPPFSLIGAALNKLAIERVDAILILPKHMKYWVSMLSQLPIIDSRDLGFHKGLYTVGSKVPLSSQTNMPRIPLMAYLVRFEY